MLVAAPLPPLTEPFSLVRSLLSSLWLWGGLAAFLISLLLWLAVLSRVQVSAAYPMTSIGYLLVVISGALWLGESVTPARIAGLFFISVGVYLIARTA
jgi:drug/metabolite transporter (DMT)-like permease